MSRSPELDEHLALLAELGVDGVSRDPVWRRRAAEPDAGTGGASSTTERDEAGLDASSADDPEPAAPVPSVGDVVAGGAEGLTRVRDELGDCTRCPLHQTRTTLVFGVGNPEADLMFVGEAPGRDEDLQGEPFVGRAGQLLTKIIEAIDLTRDEVYIANVIKCRPPNNRNPAPEEIATCQPYLFGQVDAIRPKVIVALGSFAVRTLLETEEAISRLRGRVFDYRGASLVPTFHPAYLLRSPHKKRDVWEDMKRVRSMLRGE